MDAENRGEARGTRRRIWSRLRQRRSRSWILGASAIAVGVLLASAGTAYLLISRQALSTLDEYEVTVPSTAQDAWRRPQPLATATAAPEATAGVIAPPTAEPEYVFDFASAYPADQTNPKYWSAYEFAGSGPYGSPTLPAGFEFVSVLGIVRDASEQANPVRILIPAIGLDATVSELARRGSI